MSEVKPYDVASMADVALVGGPAEERPTGGGTYATAPPPAARRVEYEVGAGGFKAGRSSHFSFSFTFIEPQGASNGELNQPLGRSSQVNDTRRVINHTEDPSLVSRVALRAEQIMPAASSTTPQTLLYCVTRHPQAVRRPPAPP
jgi:hypothetical protein